ncbi:hypothetical protein MKW92_029844 [Papaver armeniacum]|nr:hypothetical protein MKW92_029844 [Papaver armeniacum]
MFKHKWPRLQKLWISSTIVNESVPSSISNAPLLISLKASSCSIQGTLPSSFYNLSQLQLLDLSRNSITGSIPKSICENVHLRFFYFLNNNITGTIPSCMTKLQNLREFRVAGNFIEGNLSLFSLSENLTSLDMSSCNLKGLFPISICSLTNLEELDVSQNSLTGTIPSCLFKLKYLRKIDVSENKIYGPVPFPPQGIDIFILSSNKFSGEISTELGKRLFNGPVPFPPQGIDIFILSSNKFSGEISTELGKRLFNGPVPFPPQGIDIWSGAFSTSRYRYIYSTIINLAGNKLSGSVPFTLCPTEPGLFTSTQYIDLTNNKLSGTIPSNIGFCGNLDTLKLGNNNLTGIVPEELKLAKYLRFLQLNNHLNGTPFGLISEFHELEFLNLANNNFFFFDRSNKFNGSIPEDIIYLQELQLLDLSMNNLSGHIPSELGNLKGLIITSYLEDMGYGDVQLDVATKGIMIQIKQLNNYSSAIDLSSNNLGGSIPSEIGLLTLLSSLICQVISQKVSQTCLG